MWDSNSTTKPGDLEADHNKITIGKGTDNVVGKGWISLLKELTLNNGVHPETSESRIYGSAQFVMEVLDNPDHYRTLAWIKHHDYGTAFGMYTHWDLTIPLGFFHKIINIQDKFLDDKFSDYKNKDELYKKLLSLIQNETKNIFKENDTSNYTKSNEEFRITKIKKWMEELNQHSYDSEFNRSYNNWMYNILYLLHESFWEAYFKKYWDYFTTPERKKEIEGMKNRAWIVKVD